MSRLWLVRHGPTHAKSFAGWRDIPADLSDTAAITRLRNALPQRAVLVSSDLGRAITTADAIANGQKRLPHNPGLREFNFGVWDGQTFTDVAATHPDLSRQYWEQPGDIAPPGGESWNQAAARVSSAIDTLCADHPNTDIIVTAHIGAILTLVQRATRKSAYDCLAQHIDTLSLTEINMSPRWSLTRVNHCP